MYIGISSWADLTAKGNDKALQLVGSFFTFDTFATFDTCDTFLQMANLYQIEKYLKEKKIPYRVIDLGREIYTVEEVKKSGVEEGEIVKSLIIRLKMALWLWRYAVRIGWILKKSGNYSVAKVSWQDPRKF